VIEPDDLLGYPPRRDPLETPAWSEQPEKGLLWAFLRLCMMDAAWADGEPPIAVTGGKARCTVQMASARAAARMWFRERSEDAFGWGWTIGQLDLGARTIRAIEDRAFGRTREARPA